MSKQARAPSRRPMTLFLLSLLLSCTATADERFIIGVATHLMNKNGPSAKALQMLEAAGVDSVRDDAYWSIAEPHRGQLHIDPAWQAYLSKAREHKLRPLLVLGYGNPNYGNYAKPRYPPIKEGFGNYVNFVGRELADSVDFYEIWNEWDKENPVDEAFARDYSNLIEDTASKLRRQKNPVTILAGAVTSQGMDLGFADRLVSAGLLNHVDGLSLHPYVHCRHEERHTPERWIAWLRWLDADLRALVARPVPLYLTEMGWPSNTGKCGVSEQTQAAYLARSFFLAQTLPDIKGLWWYDLLDDGQDASDPEQNFGLLNPDLTVKPAYLTLKAISPFLHDYRYDAEKSRELDNAYLLRFAKGSEQILVAWTTGQSRAITVDASSVQAGNVLIIDSGQPEQGQLDTGIPWNCNDSRCSAQVPIYEFPKIFRLGSKPPLFAQ
ncbi:hypothetical protein AUC60_23740 [Pseudomonas caspiana]|uniref:Glycosyl hydrolase n=2 Tax=Pseudomonas caspiana TaxID=1451454 RepID=A0A1Y3NUQ1_9PSED|nr:hypothetical protein AUC60_23740 [Pseudomonas caspiana]